MEEEEEEEAVALLALIMLQRSSFPIMMKNAVCFFLSHVSDRLHGSSFDV